MSSSDSNVVIHDTPSSDSAFYEGRLYANRDLHAGAMVWASRRETIKRLIVRDYPDLAPNLLNSIVSGVELYATCNEKLFKDIEALLALQYTVQRKTREVAE